MASSGDGAPELAVSGHGERAAMPISGHGERAAVSKGTPLDSLDYPCTARLRFRRLLGYLRENTCGEIYSVAKARLGVIFHVEDLVEQVKEGKLMEAFNYVRIYAPFEQSSDEAELLVLFLNDLMAISSFAQGDIMVQGLSATGSKTCTSILCSPSIPASLPSLLMYSSCAQIMSGTPWTGNP
ncbi:hypothetical protein HU200_063386 [Digitaria exilis]|uniref:Uncharacterized protein n=1 Tax=Digitaria exilis TaxID=1010633 RepID=A0A835DZ75_9POAL|nr:hypothetical protein HU200_063386 [Digitaria exilis]